MIRFRPYVGLTIWTLVSAMILLSLGVWQLHRLEWKMALIAAAEVRAHATPVPIASALSLPAGGAEYIHAEATGKYVPGDAYLFSVLEDGRIGYQVLSAFRIEDGTIILVDRGFTPQEGHGPAAYSAPPRGEVRLTGLVRESAATRPFTPRPDRARRIWYARDAAAIANVLGVKLGAPLVLARDAGAPGESPEGGLTRLTFRNDHFSYALTWFGLTATLVVIYFAFHWSRGRLQFRSSQ